VQAGPGMKRTRHQRVPNLRRRGLRITAPTEAANEAILASHHIPADACGADLESAISLAECSRKDAA
jgi:hypothetical protein